MGDFRWLSKAARCREDAGRFLWSVLRAGEMNPLSEPRTDDLVRAESVAEAALRAYAENRPRCATGMSAHCCSPTTIPTGV
jgi:hypothetical protein